MSMATIYMPTLDSASLGTIKESRSVKVCHPTVLRNCPSDSNIRKFSDETFFYSFNCTEAEREKGVYDLIHDYM